MRKTYTALVAMLVMLLGLPAVAFADSHFTGTANLTPGGTNVFPSESGQSREFSIDVKNTSDPDEPGTLPGVGGSQGARIDFVEVIFPSAAGITTVPEATLAPPTGWVATVVDQPNGLQSVKYQASSDMSRIDPGNTLRFTFPAAVAAPDSSDTTAKFRVTISSDGGQTFKNADGNLTTTIRVLEVLELGALAPEGVTDQTATGGQAITYGVSVKNHAAQSLSVTPGLISNAGDSIDPASPATIASKASRTFQFPVSLATQDNGQRTSTFTGTATTPAAEASRSLGLTVQASPKLVANPNGLAPKVVRSGTLVSYNFSLGVTKNEPPSAHVSDCTLTFAQTTTSLTEAVDFDAGNGQDGTLSFESTRVSGSEGDHAVEVTCEGIDGNGFPASFDLDVPDLIIDNTAPLVDVTLDIPQDQQAVKSGDSVEISGTIDEPAEIDLIRLVPDKGGNGDEFECTPPSGKDTSFSCSVSPTYADGTMSAHAEVQVKDTAGNIGGAVSEQIEVDLKKPVLTVARTTSTQQIEVFFDEQTTIAGGCNPTQWTVNGHVVSQVRLGNQDDCTSPPGPKGQSDEEGSGRENWRILVLADELSSIDSTPVVSYQPSSDPLLADDVFDESRQFADFAELTSVPGITPAAPDLVNVQRTDHQSGELEDAYLESGDGTKAGTDSYWTNQPNSEAGQDNLVVEFAGGTEGYTLQAVDGNNNKLASVTVDESGSGSISVPTGSSDGRFVRGIRLVNAAGAGDAVFFDVVLDRVAPTISSATQDAVDDSQVTVTFNEPIPVGSNFANDWYAWEKVSGGREYYHPERVDVGSTLRERILTVPFEDLGPFGGVVYYFTSMGSGAQQYEDRAGNLLDTFNP